MKNKTMSNKETLQEAAEIYSQGCEEDNDFKAFIAGAKWQAEQDKNKYSEEEMQEYAKFCIRCYNEGLPLIVANDWFERFKLQNNEQ